MSEEMKAAVDAVEKVNKAFEEFKSTNDKRLAEIEAKGAADPLLDEKITRIEADLQKAQAVADEAVLASKRQARIVTDANGNTVDLDAKAKKWAHGQGYTDEFNAAGLESYKSAFDRFVRKDIYALSQNEQKALSVGSDPDGGYTVHPDMSGAMVKKIFDTSPIRAYASIQVIGTDALEGIYDDDEMTDGWVSETGGRAATATPQLGVWRIPVHELYAFPQITQKLLDDSAFNMEAWMTEKMSARMGRTEATAFVTGDGVGKPRGFTTYADGTSIREQVKQFNTGVNGDFAAAPAGGDVLISALYDLKSEYRANATWFMNRVTMAATRKLKDSDGAYLWQAGIQAGQPASLLGYSVAPAFEDMASSTTTGALGIAVGDMRSAYQIVERQGIRILRDNLTNKPYVGLYGVRRCGGGLINGEALKLIKFAV